MSQFPVTKNFGTNPSDVVGSIKLKGGISELLAEGLFSFDCVIADMKGKRTLLAVTLLSTPASPSVAGRFKGGKTLIDENSKREERFRKFLDKAKSICRDELEGDGSNALDIVLAKLELFEVFMREHGDKVGVPRLTIDGFVRAASTTWELGETQAAKLRASLLEVVKDKIREDMERETT